MAVEARGVNTSLRRALRNIAFRLMLLVKTNWMSALNHDDLRHLAAAQGWLELSNPQEALIELEQISDRCRWHPDVLEVRWAISAQLRHWYACVDVAQALIDAAPERPTGYIHLSYALHELEETEDAFENLLAVVDEFPTVAVIPYNLACYACQLGLEDEAWKWFRRALRIGDARRLREMALEDKDLEPLRPRIEKL